MMTLRLLSLSSALLAATLLSGCGESNARQMLGMDRSAPDAFAVSPEQPLVVPADLSHLPPPQPGLGRPNSMTPTRMAQGIVNNGTTPAASTTAPSAAEAALLQQTGAAKVSPAIRAEVNQQAKADAKEQTGGWLTPLVFWRDKPQPGVVVDPAAEAARLKKNAAAGAPATSGGTPVTEDSGRIKLPDTIE